MAKRADAIRSYEAPLGLLKQAAAQYISLSVNKFEDLVRLGVLPKPKLIAGREIWDREELRIYFKSMPSRQDELVSADNTWDD